MDAVTQSLLPLKRPLAVVANLFVVGILLAQFIPVSIAFLLAFSLIVAALSLFLSIARPFLLPLLIILAGWTNATLHTDILSPNELRLLLGDQPHIATVRGKLCETPSLRIFEQDEKEAWRTMAQLETLALCLDHGQWQSATGTVAITTPGALTNLFAGQVVEVTGVIALPRQAVAEGTFDYRAYLRQLGIYYHLKADSDQDWQIVSSPLQPPFADRFRTWARHALALGLPNEDESLRLEWALTLGWKTALTEEVSEPFVNAATYHIFAVDGLRMAIVFGIFFGLFRAVGFPRAITGVLLLPLIWFYVALTGWPASAIRATVMLSIVILGWVLKRPSDLLNSLFTAAVLILVWQPQQLFQAGFQLSFFVVLCMILVLPPMHAWLEHLFASDPLLPKVLHRRWPGPIRVPLRYAAEVSLTSFAAWVGSLPLVALYFHILTPVSTPANLVAVPLCGLVLISNLSALLLAGWFPAAAEIFNHAGWFLMECIRVSSEWFARWPAAFYYVPAPTWFTTALYYGLLLALVTGWLFRPKLRAMRISLAAVPLLLWSAHCWTECHVHCLTILPVNGGMAIYSDASGRANDLLIDCGTSNSVAFTTKPFLRGQGVNRLPLLLLTHGDLHHVGGAEMAADLFNIRQIAVSSIRFRSPTYRRLMERLAQSPDKLRRVNNGDSVENWKVLHPEPTERFPQADDSAVVLYGCLNGTRILLLSDLGRPGQKALLERYPELRADLVVTGVPSASEPVGDDLLDILQPRALVVVDSEFPASERAPASVHERLRKRTFPIVYTRVEGATTIELRNGNWKLRTMSGLKINGKML
jgi:competence protein ComEC